LYYYQIMDKITDNAGQKYWHRVGKATDLPTAKERMYYRALEMFPGIVSWLIIFFVVFLSWKAPFWVSVFIITFAIFWFLRTVYFSLHLWTGYKKMASNEKTDWAKKLKTVEGSDSIYHLVVIPMYEEPIEVVRDCLDSLIACDWPKEKMIVVLGCEERARDKATETARIVEKEYKDRFCRFMVVWHPGNIAGELAGKGANETWAAKTAKREIIDRMGIPYEKIIFSPFDVDTVVFPKYFSCLTYLYLTSDRPTRTSFQPVPLYINNIWQAPAFSRIFSFSATFWHTMNQERPEKLITFSSHSMSFATLVDVGFKQTNVVSDDSRIFWQCFLKYNGDYKVDPLYYPVSMDSNVSTSFFKTMRNIYKQQRRWAYGVADIAYFIFGFSRNKKIPLKKKLSFMYEAIEGHISWATVSIVIFLLGWLPLALGGPEFSHTMISYNLPKIISQIMTLTMVGLVSSIYLSVILLPPKPPSYGHFKYLIFLLGWLLFPFMMIFFGSLPAIDAQTRLMLGKYMGFWVTEKSR